MTIVDIRDRPDLLEQGARHFNMAFGSQGTYGFYRDCIRISLTTKAPLPRWYLALDGKKIAAGAALVTNDFVSRMDLWPWLSSLYVVNEYRGAHLGSKMMDHVLKQAAKLGFERVYLNTTLEGFYERYGWERIEDGYSILDGLCRVYRKSTSESE